MTAIGAAVAGRAAARALMADTCTITRAGVGEPVYDPATRTHTYPAATAVYTGPCKVRTMTAMAKTADAGEDVVVVARRELHLPADATELVAIDDVALITASQNAQLVGKRLRIADLGEDQTFSTARRLGVEQT